MDPAFLILVSFVLGFMSLLIAVRMKSLGAANRRVALLLAELWAVFAIWIGVLWGAAGKLGLEPGEARPVQFAEVRSRFADLAGAERVLLVMSVLLGMAVFAHLAWVLPRAMREAEDD